jgi:predicted nucleic acid-binding Zn ribbon protein
MSGPMKSLKELLGRTLAEVSSKTSSPAALQALWSQAVGASIARNASPVRYQFKTLVLRCVDRNWIKTLEVEGETLKNKVNTLAGYECVQKLEFELST